MSRPTSKKAINRLLKLELEAYQKALEALNIASDSSVKVFAALKSGDINECLQASDRVTSSAVLVANVECLATSVALQASQLEVVSSAGGLG